MVWCPRRVRSSGSMRIATATLRKRLPAASWTGLASRPRSAFVRRQLAASVPRSQPVDPQTTFLLGARELDPGEMALLAESHVTIVPVGRVATGLAQLLAQAPLDDALDYVHLDLDVLDPQVGQANSFCPRWPCAIVSPNVRTSGIEVGLNP